MSEQNDGAANLAALAAQAHAVQAELVELQRRWEMVKQNPPPQVPQLAVALANGYPFGAGSLRDVAAASEEWVRNLDRLAETAQDRLQATAEAIQLHIERWQRDAGKPNSHTGGNATNEAYVAGVRNGLGGIDGDMAAAFHPGFQRLFANLLRAVAGGADMVDVRTRINDLCRVYLAARVDDDDTYSGRS